MLWLLQLVVLVVGPGSIMDDAEALLHGFSQLRALHAPHNAAAAAAAAAAQQPQVAAAAASIHGSRTPADSSSCCSGNTQIAAEVNPIDHMQQQQQLDTQLAASPLSPRDAFFAATEVIPAAAAVGRVSAELLCPYPPGVPLVFPGEVLSRGVLAQLQATLAAGGMVTGASDARLETLTVVAQ
jgi:hypothetical protein